MDIKTTINQMGGYGKLKAMINMRDIIADSNNNCFYFKFSGSKKLNLCKITLNSMDTYDLTFYLNAKEKKCLKDIYAENLIEIFETTTCLRLSL